MWRWVLLMFALAQPVMSIGAETVEAGYRLGPGDDIEILVYGEEDMTIRTRLGDSGVISYPFLGNITLKGLTISEAEQLLIKGLKGSYLVNPAVSINILEYRPFFVNGEVNKPGAIPYQPGVTLRKAIAMAGGFTERANRSAGEVLRGNEPKARSITLDEQVKPGDIVTIKQSFF
jgi:polysaccharide biosynthesis/export protein VpsN